MEPQIYFDKESPDFNYGLWGKPERLAANRAIVCIMTEYGLCNDRRMQAHQINKLIESLQTTTGRFKEHRTKVKLKNKYIKQIYSTKPIRAITPSSLSEHTGPTDEYSLIENIS